MYMEKRRNYGTKPWCVLPVRDWRKEEDSANQIEESMARKKKIEHYGVIKPRYENVPRRRI